MRRVGGFESWVRCRGGRVALRCVAVLRRASSCIVLRCIALSCLALPGVEVGRAGLGRAGHHMERIASRTATEPRCCVERELPCDCSFQFSSAGLALSHPVSLPSPSALPQPSQPLLPNPSANPS